MNLTETEQSLVNQYYSEVREYDILSEVEEREVLNKISSGDKKAFDQLIKTHLRLVIKIAKKYQGCGLPLPDLISEGNLGLIKAAQRFDTEKNIRFLYYAYYWIRESILTSINDNSRTIRVPLSRIKNEKKNKENLTPIPTMLSLNNYLDDDNGIEFLDVLVDDTNTDDNNKWDEIGLTTKINKLLDVLDERERYVVENFFGLKNKDSKTLNDIGEDLGLTGMRIMRIKERAMRKIRNEIYSI